MEYLFWGLAALLAAGVVRAVRTSRVRGPAVPPPVLRSIPTHAALTRREDRALPPPAEAVLVADRGGRLEVGRRVLLASGGSGVVERLRPGAADVRLDPEAGEESLLLTVPRSRLTPARREPVCRN